MFESVPGAFPHAHKLVSERDEEGAFLVDESTDVIHGAIEQRRMHVGALGMTGPTSVPEAPVEFVDGVSISIVPIDRVSGARNVVLALVSSMLDALGGEGGEGGDLPQHARRHEPSLRGPRVLPAKGSARLDAVDSVRTRSTIP